jgi:nucleotidyltransferase/DNA polymerase involved in DNA repair
LTGRCTACSLSAQPKACLRKTPAHVQAEWLVRLARGLDDEVVKPRLLPKSVGCSKTFRGRSALKSLKLVHEWLLSIGTPLAHRAAADELSITLDILSF